MFFLNTLAYEEKNVDFNIEIEPYKEEVQILYIFLSTNK